MSQNVTLTATIKRLQAALTAHRNELTHLRGTVRDREEDVRRLTKEVELLRHEVHGLKANLKQATARPAETKTKTGGRMTPLTSHTTASSKPRQFIRPAEIAQIRSEMSDRRSDVSLDYSESEAEAPQVVADQQLKTEMDKVAKEGVRSQNQGRLLRAAPRVSQEIQQTPHVQDVSPNALGTASKRLSFCVPPHDVASCASCRRRERNQIHQDEDEGFSEDRTRSKSPRTISLDPEQWRRDGLRADLPPQTVLARALRELEDDFSHFKRYAYFPK